MQNNTGVILTNYLNPNYSNTTGAAAINIEFDPGTNASGWILH
jgi:hypothetical protein